MTNVALNNVDPYRRPAPEGDDEDEGSGQASYRIRRLRDAALRVKWIAVLLVALGMVGGLAAIRLVAPTYDVEAKVYLGAKRGDMQQRQGPIQEGKFVANEGLVEVLRSYRVLEPVVVKLRMHIWTVDSVVGQAAFSRLVTAPGVRGATYRLVVPPGGASYTLFRVGTKEPVGRGTFPDSIGRAQGLLWYVTPGELPEGEHKFGVLSPRDAATRLGDRIGTALPTEGQILTLRLSDPSADRAARTLNAIVDEFLTVSRELQQTQTGEYATALREQLAAAESRLRAAEQVLQTVRSENITQPTSSNGGTVDPLVGDYFAKRVSLDNLRRDRRSLEQLLQSGAGLSIEGLLSIPSATQAGSALNDALQDLGRKEAQLRAARQQYSDEYVTVRELASQVSALRRETIPRLAASKLDEMKLAERELDQTVSAFSGELRKTPQRALNEMRAKRDFDVADQFYTALLSRWNEVRLASEGSTDELKVIDRARPPTYPSSNQRRLVFAASVLGGLALAGLLIFLTDRLDGRVRYPEEVEKDLRLRLLARVPMLPANVKRDSDMLIAAQAVEAFRTVRLSLQQAFEGRGRILVVVTSEGVNDGKSLISANLAATFAESGVRTLLVDGDLRRGTQHLSYNVPLVPGFTEVLTGAATLDEAIVATETPNLSLLPAGGRSRRIPELLDRDKLTRVLQGMQGEHDVVILDSAPLGAGVDTYALGTAAGAVLMVLRHGATQRKAADGRLSALDQLPVRIIGAVLNGVPSTKAFNSYASYSYLSDYALTGGDASQPLLPKPKPKQGG